MENSLGDQLFVMVEEGVAIYTVCKDMKYVDYSVLAWAATKIEWDYWKTK